MYGMEYYLVVKISLKYLNVKCWENKMVCVLYHSFVKFMLWKVAFKSENSVKCESTKLSDNLRIISSGCSFCFWSPTLQGSALIYFWLISKTKCSVVKSSLC